MSQATTSVSTARNLSIAEKWRGTNRSSLSILHENCRILAGNYYLFFIVSQNKLHRSTQNTWKPIRIFIISTICWFHSENWATELQQCSLTVGRFSCIIIWHLLCYWICPYEDVPSKPKRVSQLWLSSSVYSSTPFDINSSGFYDIGSDSEQNPGTSGEAYDPSSSSSDSTNETETTDRLHTEEPPFLQQVLPESSDDHVESQLVRCLNRNVFNAWSADQ